VLFRSDLDGNGRKDLVLLGYENGNGRCVDGAAVTILLTGADGMPTPWIGWTHYGYQNGDHPNKAIVRDRNGNGRAEVVRATCERGEQMSEVRKIEGVYEARDERMTLVRDFPAAVLRKTEGRVTLTPPRKWTDPLAENGGKMRLQRIRSSDLGCCSICLEVDGNFVRMADHDPCEGLREDRVLYSDGVSRAGWPNLVLDGPEGREIVLDDDGTRLRKVLAVDAEVRVLGDPKAPDWLWVHMETAGNPVVLKQELMLTQAEQRRPFADDAMLYKFRSEYVYEKESVTLRFDPEKASVRVTRTGDDGLLWERTFVRPEAGAKLLGARPFSKGYLAQWSVGQGRVLTVDAEEGELLGVPKPQSFEGDLLWGDGGEPVRFLIRESGKPAWIVPYRAHVEWWRPGEPHK